MQACLSERTSVLVCKHGWSQVTRSQWKHAATGNVLQASRTKSKDLVRSQDRNVHLSQVGNSQVVTWPAMEALYL